MLDAMEQLLTGSTAGFDEEYFTELMECMALYDIDLPKAQVEREIVGGREIETERKYKKDNFKETKFRLVNFF